VKCQTNAVWLHDAELRYFFQAEKTVPSATVH